MMSYKLACITGAKQTIINLITIEFVFSKPELIVKHASIQSLILVFTGFGIYSDAVFRICCHL